MCWISTPDRERSCPARHLHSRLSLAACECWTKRNGNARWGAIMRINLEKEASRAVVVVALSAVALVASVAMLLAF